MNDGQTTMPNPNAGAVISGCGRYRYSLTRRWGTGAPMLFVMLNPSTANAMEDDPTIRRCVNFARADGHPAIEVVNLFAFRATDPKALACVRDDLADLVGPENDLRILRARDRAGAIVCAWGASVPRSLRPRVSHVTDLLLSRVCFCLGLTKGGDPRHPRYVPASQSFERYVGKPAAP